MSSGNFVIGEDLELKGFNHYIRPNIEKYKTEITDVLSYEEDGKKRVLVSLVGDADINALEKTVKISIEEAFLEVEKDERKIKDDREKLVYRQHIKTYKKGKYQPLLDTIGLYQDNKTASKIFQNLAIKYSLEDLEYKLDEVEENLRCFGGKF